MNGTTPRFWAGPLRYCRWAARERPGYFAAVFIGALGPAILITVPPIRRRLGDYDAAPIPMTYPVPTGPRKQLTGYDDDTE
ncbi:hypothetical protein N657DRAFT_569683 [Parathielavia appendiculata]|uniref:NADH-ubiquinone oxidoreductase 9.5 kDa subunit n=1 Tax=Parathielavia appendiculata TaxID=2587402 RepID=A0AAN6Z5G7_9PEZI|nr:hypothetical protein N657DRAFT_569683 [Parathielavia appendiculata]